MTTNVPQSTYAAELLRLMARSAEEVGRDSVSVSELHEAANLLETLTRAKRNEAL